jgi:hypothetical protein
MGNHFRKDMKVQQAFIVYFEIKKDSNQQLFYKTGSTNSS